MDFSPKKELLRFLAEDIGKGDITSNILPKKKIKARIVTNESAVLAGIKFVSDVFNLKKCKTKILKKDGVRIKPKDIVIEVSGSAQAILACERTTLNLLSRMSGIATQTNFLLKKIRKINSKTQIYATRKTAPGLRFFDKQAVTIGGGHKHRMSLDEMIMIKDNHLAISSLSNLINNAKKKYKKIEVEVENQNYAIQAAKQGASIIMLDNFMPRQISKTILQLEKLGLRNKIKLEASGGINNNNIQSFAKTGIDIISVGGLTHSVKGIDFSLEVIN